MQRIPRATARWVLPTPGGPSSSTLAASGTKDSPASSRTWSWSLLALLQTLPLARKGEALPGMGSARVDRKAFVSCPDLHGALVALHLHQLAGPRPADAVPGPLPLNVPVTAHPPIIPEEGRQ